MHRVPISILNNYMATLEKAIEIAAKAHAGQKDKSGQPYIMHPLWLMQQFEDEEFQIVAVLHDVVEDSAFTLEDLATAGFAPAVIAGVEAMTHREGESYTAYIDRVQAHPIALRVKLADLEHNMDVRRLARFQDKDRDRLEKYHQTWRKLKKASGL